jgi:hypothetical protein
VELESPLFIGIRGAELKRRFSIDNLTDKCYFETQNYFESEIRPGDPVIARIHGMPGYPITVMAGVTFRLFKKD